MTEQTDPALNASAEQQAGVAANPNVVPDHIIPAELPHPKTEGGVLARGVRYLHHFELLLVSDGKRLWAAASEEGRAVMAAITGEKQDEADQIEAHKSRTATAAAEQKAAEEAAAKNPPVIDARPKEPAESGPQGS